MANAIVLSYFAYHDLQRVLGAGTLPLLLITALVFFLANTIPVAVIISVTEGKPAHKVWGECHFWSFPFYMVGAAVVFAVGFLSKHVGWQTSLLTLSLVYWVYRSYHLYLAKLAAEKKQVEIEKRHAEEVAALHLRTIESLALAIEAKDHTSHQHLQRVRVFTVEVAKELGFSESEIEALRAAALLHDIGKLAIPEHIINKPGRLTPEEFEKMKIHTRGGRRNSAARGVSLSGRAHRSLASRALGRNGLSRRAERRADSSGGARTGRRRLSGCPVIASPVSQRHVARCRHGKGRLLIRHGVRAQSCGSPQTPLPGTGSHGRNPIQS